MSHASGPRTAAVEIEHQLMHRVTLARYFWVWAALSALTLLTFALSRIDVGAWNVVIALAIATLKAGLVLLFFMHLREAGGSIRLVVLVTVSLLALLLGLTLVDLNARFQWATPQPELENGAVP